MIAANKVTSQEMETLLRVSSALTSSLDLPTVLQTAISSAVEVLGLDTGAIYTLEGDNLFIGATTPTLTPDFPMELRFAHLNDHPHIAQALDQKDVLLLPDIRQVELSAEEHAAVEARSLVTVLYVPLIVDGEPRGALILGSQHDVRAFSAHQMRLSRTLAHQISLAVANSQLFEAISKKNRELELTHREMTEYADRLSAMTVNLASAERKERRRLAEELHDRVSQSLAVAKMTLSRAMTDGQAGHARELAAADSLIEEALSQTRAITEELSPAVLLQPGLAPALRRQCDHVHALYGLEIETRLDGCECDASDDLKVFMYRVAHELLLNIVKHAEATRAWLSATCVDGTVILTVRDDGIGIRDGERSSDAAGGFGLLSIAEQLSHVGGALDIESECGAGTQVTVRVPV